MKKLFVLMLVATLVLTACGSASTETTTEAPTGPMTFEEFQAKYKRASWDDFLADPLALVRDYHESLNLTKEEWTQDWSIFTFKDDPTLPSYEGNVVLFNHPFEVHVWEKGYAPGLGGIMIVDDTDTDKFYDSFKVIFEKCLQELGDPAELVIHYETVSEADFRTALSGPFEYGDSYEATWHTDDLYFTVTLDHFKDHASIQLR